MMRLFCITALTTVLAACQTFESGPGRTDELAALLDYEQSLDRRDDVDLTVEAEQLRTWLTQSSGADAATRVRLLMLESRIQLRELRKVHEAQLQQIQALNTQIEALTAIEQQINRRGQLQETVNE